MALKKCTKCGIEKELNQFSKQKGNKSGLRGRCNACRKTFEYKPKAPENARRDSKKYRDKNPNKAKELWVKWYEKNRERVLAKVKDKYKATNGEYTKAWAAKNKDRINELKRKRRKNHTVEQVLEKKLRDRFYKVIVIMKSGRKHQSPLKLVGCNLTELKAHIENQFLEGMNWSNHGNGEGKWNIDHIVQLNKFDLFSLEDQHKAFHFTNLRPLWSLDNFRREGNQSPKRAKKVIQ